MRKLESVMPLIGLFIAQCFITFVLYVICNFASLFSGYVVAGPITFTFYALVWLTIWWVQWNENGIDGFYPKLVAATLPLVVFTAAYICMHPTPTYMTMIPVLPKDIHFDFSTAVTGTILFPLYTMVLEKYFFTRRRPWVRLAGAGSLFVFGGLIFASCYSLLPQMW